MITLHNTIYRHARCDRCHRTRTVRAWVWYAAGQRVIRQELCYGCVVALRWAGPGRDALAAAYEQAGELLRQQAAVDVRAGERLLRQVFGDAA
jgi:MinD superfamily P-loop ATPase